MAVTIRDNINKSSLLVCCLFRTFLFLYFPSHCVVLFLKIFLHLFDYLIRYPIGRQIHFLCIFLLPFLHKLLQRLLSHQFQLTFCQFHHLVHAWVVPVLVYYVDLTVTYILSYGQYSIEVSQLVVPDAGYEALEGPLFRVETYFVVLYLYALEFVGLPYWVPDCHSHAGN